MATPSTYGLKEFEDLSTSTRTFMVYTSLDFDLQAIFDKTPTTTIDVPLTKRKKHIDRKKLTAPLGAIVSLQKSIYIRGLDTRKVKKHWCTSCRLTTEKGEDKVKQNTVIEELKLEEDTEDVYKIHYYCTNCQHYYTSKELGEISYFLNQVTVTISVGDVLLNVMIFKDCFKIAGCKRDEDSVTVTKILWEEFFRRSPSMWKLKSGEQDVKFIFRRVMRNVGFNLGFAIDLNKLNTLMNKEEYAHYVDVSQRETTGHPNVNISMFSQKPDDYSYDMLVYKKGKFLKEGVMTTTPTNPYEKKKEKKTHTTFIVFSSSQIILSGRYQKEMKNLYNFFVNEVMSNKEYLQETLRVVGTKKMSFLGRMEVS